MAKVTVTNSTNFTKQHMNMKRKFNNYSKLQGGLVLSLLLNVILLGILLV